jgi:hypothetical protein
MKAYAMLAITRIKWSFAIFCAVAAIGACTSTPEPRKYTYVLGVIQDVVSQLNYKAPPPTATITYAQTADFDAQLNSSLHARLPTVTVSNLTFTTQQLPANLNAWLVRLDGAGNKTWTCPGTQNSAAVLETLFLVYETLAPVIKTWRTYAPVKNYDAVFVVKEDGTTVDSVIFYEKNREQPDRLRCMAGIRPLEQVKVGA